MTNPTTPTARRQPRLAILALGMAALATSGVSARALGQTIDFTIDQPASSATFTLGVDAPFLVTPSGTCFLIGDFDAAGNPGGVKTGTGFTVPTVNSPVPITAGSVTASGGSGATPLRPRGSLRGIFDPGSGSARVENLSLDVLGGASVSAATNASVRYSTFRTSNGCFLPGLTISVPLGNAAVTAALATQTGTPAVGTLTPVSGSVYQFSVPVEVLVETTATLNGAPLPVAPVTRVILFTGTVDLGAEPVFSGTAPLSLNEVQPGPTPLAPLPVPLAPLCSATVLANITLSSTTLTGSATATLSGAGVLAPAAADFNRDGSVNDDDLGEFVAAYFEVFAGPGGYAAAPCPGAEPPFDAAGFRADFTRDCTLNDDDLGAFITAYFAQ